MILTRTLLLSPRRASEANHFPTSHQSTLGPMAVLDLCPSLPSFCAMQMNFRKSATATIAGMLLPAIGSAHPGHAPADFVAQVSQPFAGVEHFVVFAGLSGCLLTVLALVLKLRSTGQRKNARVISRALAAKRQGPR